MTFSTKRNVKFPFLLHSVKDTDCSREGKENTGTEQGKERHRDGEREVGRRGDV